MKHKGPEKDKGYAWVILACSCMGYFFRGGQFASFGLLLLPFLEYFQVPKGTITAMAGIYYFLGNLLAPLLSTIGSVLGWRVLMAISTLLIFLGFSTCFLFPYLPVVYIFFSCVAGLGFAGMQVSSYVQLQEYFDKRRGLATGCLSSFYGLGVVIIPQIMSILLDHYSWRGTLLVMAAIHAHGLVLALLMKPFNRNPQKKEFKEELKKMLKAFTCSYDSLPPHRGLSFVFYLISSALTTIGCKAVLNYTHLTLAFEGYTRQQSTVYVSLLGSFLVVAFLFGAFSDLQCVNRLVVMVISSSISGAIVMVMPLFSSPAYYYGMYIALAFFTAALMGVVFTIVVDIVGVRNVASANGIFTPTMNILDLVMHPIAGKLVDLTGGTAIIFFVFGGCQVTGALFCLLSFLAIKMNTEKERDYKDTLEVPVVIGNSEEDAKTLTENGNYLKHDIHYTENCERLLESVPAKQNGNCELETTGKMLTENGTDNEENG